MDWKKTFERIKLFIVNIPQTVKETFIWLSISYLIPIINIGIIWGIQRDNFEMSIEIVSIILVTNACFFTSLFYLVFSNKKERKLLNTINIVTYVITVVLFTVSIIEVEILQSLFSLELYKVGALLTFLIAILLGLISKYDEVEAISRVRAEKSKRTTSTNLDGKKVKI